MVNDLVSSQQHIQNNMQSNNDVVHRLQDAQVEQKAAMDMLAKQLSQIATSLSEMRENEGRIPASVKPLDRANISQITLRSGRGYEETREAETWEVKTVDDDKSKNSEKPITQEADQHFSGPGVEVEIEEIRKETGESSEEDISHKEKQQVIKEFIIGKTIPSGKIVIGEIVSVVIQKRRMPSKRTDPGMFTFPISIGNIKVEHAMCDLGASINVLPLSLYKKLEGVRMVDTKVVIQLADWSCISPEGVFENVIVMVHDFLYPVDFHVIKISEYQSAESSGVLLRRPFLRIAKTIIDEQVENSELSHSIDKEVANWCEAINTLRKTDEELVEAILEFCKSPESARSKRSAHATSVENLPKPEGLLTKETKKINYLRR
ncbi:uncharacterized protein LOC121774451 [Salvia splendens]|uniref:uncharacterized protein LOC121774451 n=1 Tax=Salvia splendens TaxID=180675 RepID=UPI001C276FFA|nr:uncharacterized protein LOC121774451 [Salvia splendens]